MISVIDRVSDFRILARWFAQAESDAMAHALWGLAFGLSPAGSRIIDQTEEHSAAPGSQWKEFRPQTGVLRPIVDRSAEKQKLSAAAHLEAQRLLRARERFGTRSRIRLSELEHLESGEFELLLDLLGEALAVRTDTSEPVEILSGDGCFRVSLEPVNDGNDDGKIASILTADGWLSGPDHWLGIEEVRT